MYKKLLFVDDQPDVLLLLERDFCRRTDVITFSARDLSSALQVLETNDIGVVISDVHLGSDSGFDFARILRAKYPRTGLILTSGWNVKTNQHKAEILDVVFLSKPFKLKDLSDLIDTFLVDYSEPIAEETQQPDSAPISENRALAHFQPQDLVQLFCLNGRDVEISIKPDGEHLGGRIYIQRGQVVHAEFESLWGDEAFIQLMHMSNPILNLKTVPCGELKQTVQTSWEQLLLRAAVRFDERGESPSSDIDSTADYARDQLPNEDE